MISYFISINLLRVFVALDIGKHFLDIHYGTEKYWDFYYKSLAEASLGKSFTFKAFLVTPSFPSKIYFVLEFPDCYTLCKTHITIQNTKTHGKYKSLKHMGSINHSN